MNIKLLAIFSVLAITLLLNPTTSYAGGPSPPTVSCPPHIVVEVNTDTSPSTTGTATSTGGDAVHISFSDTPFLNLDGTGMITRTWTATDDSGNQSSCAQIITIIDATQPNLTTPPDAVVILGNPTDPSSTGTATATDNSNTSPAVTFVDILSLNPDGTGMITRTWTATDDSGNTDSSDQIITIISTGDATDNLLNQIDANGDIPKNAKSSLLGPLKQVSKILNDDNQNNNQAACDKLTAFLDNLAAKADKINDPVLVGDLEDAAKAIKDAIGCPLN